MTWYWKITWLLIAVCFAGLAIYTEFRTIKTDTWFFNWANYAPLVILWAITLTLLVITMRYFLVGKNLFGAVPVLICIGSLAAIYWHKKEMERIKHLPTIFVATTRQIGSDGGFLLDFKKDGFLRAERRDHGILTWYVGKYHTTRDTIIIGIALDFKLGKKAVIKGDSLFFVNDKMRFAIIHPPPGYDLLTDE
jgi:hypothetical protein